MHNSEVVIQAADIYQGTPLLYSCFHQTAPTKVNVEGEIQAADFYKGTPLLHSRFQQQISCSSKCWTVDSNSWHINIPRHAVASRAFLIANKPQYKIVELEIQAARLQAYIWKHGIASSTLLPPNQPYCKKLNSRFKPKTYIKARHCFISVSNNKPTAVLNIELEIKAVHTHMYTEVYHRFIPISNSKPIAGQTVSEDWSHRHIPRYVMILFMVQLNLTYHFFVSLHSSTFEPIIIFMYILVSLEKEKRNHL